MKKENVAIALCAGITIFSSLCLNTARRWNEPVDVKEEINKPEKITACINRGYIYDLALNNFCDEYYKNTGVRLEVKRNEYGNYTAFEKSMLEDGDTDVIQIDPEHYTEYANKGLLWDMTDAWEKSPLRDKIDKKYIDALSINGRLYGFPVEKYPGTVTYLRKDWLDEAGLDIPASYDEFLNVLRAFKARGEDIVPYTAAGLLWSEQPGSMYLSKFYQDADPGILYDEEKGEYYDGFTTPEMYAAIQRLKYAYAEGLIDHDILDNYNSTCYEKVEAGQVGALNCWAGYWNERLDDMVKKTDPTGEFIAIPPIDGEKYMEHTPYILVISSKASDPEAIFKYFIEYSHDGGEGEMLFSRGVENVTYELNEKGEANIMPVGDSYCRYAFYDPLKTITDFDDPVKSDDKEHDSLDVFYANSSGIYFTIYNDSEIYNENIMYLMIIKAEILEKTVCGDMSVDDGMKEYRERSEPYISEILDYLNEYKNVLPKNTL